MKLLLSVVVLFLALNEVFAEEMGPNEDQDYWANGSIMQDDWLQADPFREILRRITRKPRPHQFIGLMGKRSSGHKINSFVGLMGKRSQEEPDSYDWSLLQSYEERR
ncbi:protachykinin-1 isoform X2 [Pangasianodon hypophthalmus]|uniref:protachykinin-1 isoform X2 n=1 Tax=Pangasianodon hypophthalmus TaxID=310915 RepID=UPI000F000DE5|nr:protachykinin-1 isoform X2 [Pangasianodon hypophthalmus]